MVVMRKLLVPAVASVLAALAVLSVWTTFRDPVTWTPDGLYYQVQLLEFRGVEHDEAYSRTFEGPLSAELRARDPHHTGNAVWAEYNEPFYERRVALPLVGAALYPLTEDRTLLYLSLAGYVAVIVALFLLLLLRFRLAIAAAVTTATVFLPPLVHHAAYPLTDTWGLTLEIGALIAALLALERGLRWLPLWAVLIGVLALTRDSTWIPILGVGWLAFRLRTREPVLLFVTGIAAALPALLLFKTPVRELLALLVNESEPSADTSWGFILGHYPEAVIDLVRANVGFLRRGEWYTALYFLGGVAALFTIAWKQRAKVDARTSLFVAAGVAAILYVLAAPVFSAFRLELAALPMAAWGIAMTVEWVTERVGQRARRLTPVAVPLQAPPQ